MREIKFRVWNKDAGCFDYVQLSGGSNDGFGGISNLDWQQFTGLHDKNGNEIYEGDIVAYDYASTPIEHRKGAVEWSAEYCGWRFDDLLIEPTPRKTIEVIGNIYENPELLRRAVS
jgi:hypothetical protein